MAEKPPQLRQLGQKDRAALALIIAVAVVLAAIIFTYIAFRASFFPPLGDPVFTVAITGVTGLDPARDVDPPTSPPADNNYSSSSLPPPPLSPVFNLTFQIDNTHNAYYDACVPGLSRADVSYGDAFLAGGSVPPFCAREERTSGRVAATAWGDSVAVPKFLRDKLAAELAAGDASVDVKVTMPRYCRDGSCGGAVLSCKPKIRGGMSPACRLDFLQASPASPSFIERLEMPFKNKNRDI